MAPRELRLSANGLEFFALDEGPEDGPLVLLLHGFPELSRSWRHQLHALGGAGEAPERVSAAMLEWLGAPALQPSGRPGTS